jgi:phosphoserine aminotransferase
MNRLFNFNAGPSTLPIEVLQTVRDEWLEYRGKGMSIIEMSHRSPEYDEVHNGAIGLIREMLHLPDDYSVLFLGGGATLQFSMIPLNLLGPDKSCDFTVTGTWAKKALADARKVGKVNVVFDGAEHKYTTLPGADELALDSHAAYLHLTSNETIGGVQWHQWPETGNVPIVCDMSSDILSRPLPVEKFGLIYAGAQKNLGPAGLGVTIIRKDLLERCAENLPAYLSYRTHAEKNSLYNTPPVFAVYMTRLVLEKLEAAGGVEVARERSEKKAALLYDAIEGSGDYYRCPVPAPFRSNMNVVFRLPDEELEKTFLQKALDEGLGGLKGHRSVGGCRASIYNAMPVEGVEALAGFMQHFATKHG